MNQDVQDALHRGGLADITTTGAKSGKRHRIEIAFHNFDGEIYLTGRPGTRDWYANVVANPSVVLHVRRPDADIATTASAITDEAEKEQILWRILTESWNNEESKARHILPRWVAGAPLVRLTVDD